MFFEPLPTPTTAPASGNLMPVGARTGHTATLEYFPDVVRRIAGERPDQPALTVLDGGIAAADIEDDALTRGARTLDYATLDLRVRALAVALRERCDSGTRVAILCAHDEHYIVAFLACLYADVVGVPLHAPEFFRGQARLRAVLRGSAPGVVLTTSRLDRPVRVALKDAAARAEVMHVDTLDTAAAGAWRRPDYAPGRVAYLQYTSGSTRAPEGVRISHRNLAVAAWQLRRHFMPARTAVSWVPLFHDMGLICGVVSPLAAGVHMVHMSPVQFLRDPFLWLAMISHTRADWTVAPNFALRYCVDAVDPKRAASLALDSLSVLAIGGEMVRPETLDVFADRFSVAGFHPSALAPSYGLAEATLTVAVSPRGAGNQPRAFDRSALVRGVATPAPSAGAVGPTTRLVGCGEVVAAMDIRIVDPDQRRVLAPGHVGEVWVRGPNCSDGYWGAAEDPLERFSARLVGEDDDGRPWVRTRDAGFVHEGALYVTGRIDDAIILRGENHFPEDLEGTVEEALPGTRAVVIAVEPEYVGGRRPDPRVVVLVETRRRSVGGPEVPEPIDTVRRAVRREHGVAVADVVLVRSGSLPRTTSGKPRRAACRERYVAGALR
ncbi:fatty acyl-AMP ligase [Spiractinospora alimapuensis]|uniref:fatty acyl-AMP ligase n=1 Tax=Spiractinospora alimapuensis TaxID=2820884 RepID=UPI001F1FC059|nr:fatty acyl-AMP ligase [Spiractinospora alimapuensis]QVQ51825.1 fatty acyl-AMP ligase [Spiractinospora alimapuensis]